MKWIELTDVQKQEIIDIALETEVEFSRNLSDIIRDQNPDLEVGDSELYEFMKEANKW